MRLWYEKMHVIQDMLVPVTSLGDSLAVFRQNYDLYEKPAFVPFVLELPDLWL